MRDAGHHGVPSIVPPQDESDLIAEAQRGSAAAFEDLVRLHDAAVLRLALRMMRSEDEARDIYQEAFLKAYRSIREFRGRSSFKTWLFRIITNLCLDRARRQAGRRDEPLPDRVGDRGDDWTVEAAKLLVDRRPGSDPERALEAGEVRRRVGEAVGRLPERERLVFALRHDEGLRLAAIAEILETSEETVRNCLYRAHQRLRAALSDLRWSAAAAAPGRAAPAAERRIRATGRPETVNGVKS
jgi:RNA polymerase sigma-70 factor (ECF subfamily)